MTELPKELTPELLGLVLDREVEEIYGVEENNLRYRFKNSFLREYLNIDTLTMRMIEFIQDNGFLPQITFAKMSKILPNKTKLQTHIVLYGKGKKHGNEQLYRELLNMPTFEAVLKATHFVAKNKGLIK